jgi:hypothetical protein
MKWCPTEPTCIASATGEHCKHTTGEYNAVKPPQWFVYCCYCGDIWHEIHQVRPYFIPHGKFYSSSGLQALKNLGIVTE